jgi:predicted homoserine dehydrogenase-like protein
MMFRDLKRLQSEGKFIRIGMSGTGWMAEGFLAQMRHVPGMKVVAVTDRDTQKATTICKNAGMDVVVTENLSIAEDAVRTGKCVVSKDCTLAARLEQVDLLTDVTPSPASGVETAYAGIQHGKDVVLINIEADVTAGRILKKYAKEKGVLYSVSSGDEPGCLMELWDFVQTLGYEPIVIGKGKNNPLNPSANPETVAKSARKAGKDPYQVASYVDGTKTMFEMACAANATGCSPMKRGMVGPQADLKTVSRIFALTQDGGIATSPNCVDFVQGESMAGGVFVTVRVTDGRLRGDLQYLKVGKGSYFTFFRPYHLWFLEAPISFAKAYLYRQETLFALDVPYADVMTIAKRDLDEGSRLDDFGGYSFYGMIEKADEARRLDALPAGLAPGARVLRSVKKGDIVTWKNVDLNETLAAVKLRRMQDKLEQTASKGAR